MTTDFFSILKQNPRHFSLKKIKIKRGFKSSSKSSSVIITQRYKIWVMSSPIDQK